MKLIALAGDNGLARLRRRPPGGKRNDRGNGGRSRNIEWMRAGVRGEGVAISSRSRLIFRPRGSQAECNSQ